VIVLPPRPKAAASRRTTYTEFRTDPAKAADNVFLYQKLGASGEHLKYGITKSPGSRYSLAQLNGGRLNLLAHGPKEDMLSLERALHETLPIGPEEGQLFYIEKQVSRGLRPPPYVK